jgi:hypothetical protein
LEKVLEKNLVLIIITRYNIKISYILRKNEKIKIKKSETKGRKQVLYITITLRDCFFDKLVLFATKPTYGYYIT